MAAKAVGALILMAMLLGGCGLLHDAASRPAAAPAAMTLTPESVASVRTAVTAAKAKALRPESRDDYVRYARTVYVASWANAWSAAATTEVALAQAKAGSGPAREYLTIMVYDIQLHSAMEGVSLTAEDWRGVYVGSGIMTDAAFTGYAAMSRGGKVLP